MISVPGTPPRAGGATGIPQAARNKPFKSGEGHFICTNYSDSDLSGATFRSRPRITVASPLSELSPASPVAKGPRIYHLDK